MNFELNDDDVIMRDILKLAFGGDCEVVFPKLDTNQVLSRTILGAIIMTMTTQESRKTKTTNLMLMI